MALGGDALRGRRIEAVAQVEVAVGLGIERAGAERDVGAAEIARLARQQRQAEALAQPAGEADVVGMEVRDDQAGQGPARQRPGDERVPDGARGVVADAGVQDGPAVAVIDQVDVDVVEPERQGNARPQDARRDLDDLPRGGRLRHREDQGVLSVLVSIRLRSATLRIRAQRPILGMDCCTAPSPWRPGSYAAVLARGQLAWRYGGCGDGHALSHSAIMTETVAARNRTTRGVLLLAVVVLAWGTMWPVNKALLAYMTPVWSIALRTYISASALFAISIFMTGVAVPKRGDAPVLVSMVLLHMVGFTILTQLALQFVPAGQSTVLAYTSVLWAPMFAALFLGERLSLRRALGLGLGVLGLIVIFNPATFDWSNRGAVLGNAAILLAAMLWAASIVHNRGHAWRSTPFQLAPWQALLAAAILTLVALRVRGAARGAVERPFRAAAAVRRHPRHRARLLGGGGELLRAARLHHVARADGHARGQHRRIDGTAGRAADVDADRGAGADPARRGRRHLRRQCVAARRLRPEPVEGRPHTRLAVVRQAHHWVEGRCGRPQAGSIPLCRMIGAAAGAVR